MATPLLAHVCGGCSPTGQQNALAEKGLRAKPEHGTCCLIEASGHTREDPGRTDWPIAGQASQVWPTALAEPAHRHKLILGMGVAAVFKS